MTAAIQQRNAEMVDLLTADFLRRNERSSTGLTIGYLNIGTATAASYGQLAIGDALSIDNIGSGAASVPSINRNAIWNGANYLRTVVDNDASILELTAAGDLRYRVNSDALSAIGSIVTPNTILTLNRNGRLQLTGYSTFAAANGDNSANIQLTRSAANFVAIGFQGGVANAMGIWSGGADDSLHIGWWNGGVGNYTNAFSFFTSGIFQAGDGVTPNGGSVFMAYTDTGTTNSAISLEQRHYTTGTPAAGFGSRWRVSAQDDTNVLRVQADDLVEWVSAVAASYKARRRLGVYDSTTTFREGLRIEASGAAAMIGFLGAAAIVRPIGTTDIRQALIDLGLYTTGGISPLSLNGGLFQAGFGVFTNTLSGTIIQLSVTDAATTTGSTMMSYEHNSSGAVGVGFGIIHSWALESTTTNGQPAADDLVSWATAADATRKSRRQFYIYNIGAAQEAIRIEGAVAGPMIGFLGAAAVVRQAIGAAAPAGGVGTAAGGYDTAINRNAMITLVNNMRTALINLGLAV